MSIPFTFTELPASTVGHSADADAVDAGPSDALGLIRQEIALLLSQRNYAGAAEKYEALVAQAPDQVLSRRHMLDIANQLASQQFFPQAADAYEQFLRHYPNFGECQGAANRLASSSPSAAIAIRD